MSESTVQDSEHKEVDVSEFFRRGLPARPCSSFDSDERDTSSDQDVNSTSRPVSLLYGEKLSEKEARTLRHILETNPSVKQLTLWYASMNILELIFGDMEKPLALEELGLLYVDCDGHDFCLSLSEVFSNLRALDVRCRNQAPCIVTGDGGGLVRSIADFLLHSRTLQELALWSDNLGDAGAQVLADALTTNDTLKKLEILDGTQLTSKAVLTFANALVVNSALELVDLSEVDMQEEEVLLLCGEDRYADTFKRVYTVWKQQFLPQLTKLVRENRHFPDVSVEVTSSVRADLLEDFFNAVAENNTVRMLHFYPSGKTFDALADGIADVLRRTSTITNIRNLMRVEDDYEALIKVLSALKDNRSVTDFTMVADVLTPEICRSLSELLASNKTLTSVNICECAEIAAEHVHAILQGLRENYTLTDLTVVWDPDDDTEEASEIEELLKRNRGLLDRAAHFVKRGGDVSDVEGVEALKIVHQSPGLVETLEKLTGKATAEVRDNIKATFTRVSC
ncbi:hypothetical protein HPB48_006049 [Haemaphysalis longicornis]|uniref:Uncharacterized protein n=1 Tax=Haemaphysalis longicornis TaxID=44386 RepID=A0A9J6FEB0_HAELO|nr:hypothetical protein HPB48_006049 [Haemaphysalis longicornis]